MPEQDQLPIVIQLKNLTRRFNQFTAVDTLNLEICKGTIFALLGPNGSGKSTTINMAAGLISPTSGDLLIEGLSILDNPLRVKKIIGVVPEDPALFKMLSIWEHLMITGPIYGLSLKETETRAEELLKFFELWEDRDKNINYASFGMKKKLSIAMALVHSPSVIFLDEPFKGLDPVAAKCVRELMATIAGKGCTIFLSTHLAANIERIIDEFAIISHGKICCREMVNENERNSLDLEEIFFKHINLPTQPALQWMH
ncbi:MAG: ABC transporter ATP-binding protein [bacterium]|nr:ABC transporter ATP-binding protein [bacterium]